MASHASLGLFGLDFGWKHSFSGNQGLDAALISEKYCPGKAPEEIDGRKIKTYLLLTLLNKNRTQPRKGAVSLDECQQCPTARTSLDSSQSSMSEHCSKVGNIHLLKYPFLIPLPVEFRLIDSSRNLAYFTPQAPKLKSWTAETGAVELGKFEPEL